MPLPRNLGLPTNVSLSLTMTYNGLTPALAGQFIGWDGQLVIAPGTSIAGVLREDATTGKNVSVAMSGLVEVLSGGAVAVGNAIGADIAGKGAVAAAGAQIFGRVFQGSPITAANQRFQMFITREGTT